MYFWCTIKTDRNLFLFQNHIVVNSSCFSPTEQPGSALNLRYILDWAWNKVVQTKEELDGICMYFYLVRKFISLCWSLKLYFFFLSFDTIFKSIMKFNFNTK